MALFRKLLRRRKADTPVSVSASGAAVAQPSQQPRESPRHDPASEHDQGVRDDHGRPEPPEIVTERSAMTAVEPKGRLFSGGKARTLSEMQRTHDEVMGLVRKIGDHLDTQALRSQHMDRVVEKLPQTLEVLPEMNRQNAQLLAVIQEHLGDTRARGDKLNNTLADIATSANRNNEMLELLQKQLAAGHRVSEDMTETLGDFRHALRDLGHSNSRAVEVLSNMATAAELRESKLEMMLQRTQTFMIAALMCCGGAAIVALIIAIVIGMKS